MWHKAETGRGCNQIATCPFLELINLPLNVKRVTLYSDTCGGQYINSHVFNCYAEEKILVRNFLAAVVT